MINIKKNILIFKKHIKSPLSFYFKLSFATKIYRPPLFSQVSCLKSYSSRRNQKDEKSEKTFLNPTETQKLIETYFSMSEFEENEEIPLPIKNNIKKSNYVSSLLKIYQANIGLFNENNIIYLIKQISKLFSNLMDDINILKDNPDMISLLQTLKNDISIMKEQVLIQTLIFFRKLQDRKYFKEIIVREDFDNIIMRFKELCDLKQVSFNNACLFYYESAYLRISTAVCFKYIDEILRNHEIIYPHINAYYLIILMKALYSNKDFKKSEIFWKNLLFIIDYQTKNLRDVNLLVQSFTFLMELEFQDKLSKNLEIFAILKNNSNNLIQIFKANSKILLNFDILNLLKGFSVAPAWVDRSFLQDIKKVIIDNFDNQAYYDLNFRLKFLETMGNSNPMDQLDNITSDNLLSILNNHLSVIEIKKISTYHQIVKAIYTYQSQEKTKIYEFVVDKINNTPLSFNTVLPILLVLKIFLDDKFPCEQSVIKIIEFYQTIIESAFLERVSLAWDVAFHPNLKEKTELKNFQGSILKIFIGKVNDKPQTIFRIIDIFGDRLKRLSSKNLEIQIVLRKLEKIILPNIQKFSTLENIKLELFFNSEILEQNDIVEVLKKGKFSKKKLSSNDFEILLKFFRRKTVKSIDNFQLMLRGLFNMEEEGIKKNLNLIFIVLSEFPSNFFQENPTQVLGILTHLFEKLPKDIDLKDYGLSYQTLLDLSDFFQRNGIFEFHYHALLLAKAVLNHNLIQEISLYKLSEIGFVIGMAMNKQQIRLMWAEDHVILIEALRKIAEYLEIGVLENVQQEGDKKDPLKIYKDTVLFSRFLKIYYKAFFLDLRKKDPIFVGHSISQVKIKNFIIINFLLFLLK